MDQREKQRRYSQRRLHPLPISRLFPNMITISGLCCGMTSIRFALNERWEISVAFLLAAAIIDGMDGRVARMLNSTSLFGAQLDSLSDFISFGVAPAMLLYMWKMHEIKGIGWAMALFYVVCAALRLARFNTGVIEDKKEAWKRKFFVGIPSPSGAMLALMPLVLSFHYQGTFFENPIFIVAYTPLVAVLMASRIPTFSAKGMRIRHELILPIMLLFGLWAACFIIEPWITFFVSGLIYFCLIPVSMIYYQKLATLDESSSLESLPIIPK